MSMKSETEIRKQKQFLESQKEILKRDIWRFNGNTSIC